MNNPAVSGASWFEGTLVGFDLETTGVDPLQAHIVTAAIVYLEPDGSVGNQSRNWLVDPGVPIPDGAAAIHGITTEYAAANGLPANQASLEISEALQAVWKAKLPLVVFNAAYDLTLLSAELRRHQQPDLASTATWIDAYIIDPLVIDRGVDRYRRGKRTLESAGAHYSIGDFSAHTADADAMAACHIARAIAQKFPDVGRASARDLHHQQQEWSQQWAVSFQSYLRSRGQADAVIDGTWPMR